MRVAREADAAAIAEIYRPFVEDSWVSFEERAPDAREMARRITALEGEFPWLVAEADGEIAGYAYAGGHRSRAAYRWSVDVSAYFDERFRRRGIATQLYGGLFAVLVAQGYVNAFAGISLPNVASVGFHRHTGFTTIGIYANVGYKAGAWRDTMWLERELRPRVAQPAVPRRLAALHDDDVAKILAPFAVGATDGSP